MSRADIILPIDLDGDLVTVELAVEYEYTRGYPAWIDAEPWRSHPAGAPQVDVRSATVERDDGYPVAVDRVQAAVNRRVAAGWPALDAAIIAHEENERTQGE